MLGSRRRCLSGDPALDRETQDAMLEASVPWQSGSKCYANSKVQISISMAEGYGCEV